MPLNVAIIGGGISGLASAARVAAMDHRVTLLEGDSDLGGLGTTFPWRDRHLERFYHCILPTDRALIAWIREVGLERDLMWKRVTMGFTYRGRTWTLDTPLDLLRFGPLTFGERLRLGLMGLRARRMGDDRGLDAISAEAWVRRYAGDRVFEVLWRPLLEAKIGDGYAGIPALWLTSRLSRDKNAGPEVKGCLAGGYRSLIDAFAAHLRGRGVEIRMGARVTAIDREGERVALVYDGGARQVFDVVVSTLPLIQFQAMTRGLGLDAKIADLVVDYQGVVSGVFLTERALTPYYWMPVVDSGVTAQGMVAMSNLVPLERANGLHVNYLMNYTHRDSALFRKSDEELMAIHRADLEKLFPDAAGSVVEQRMFRAPYVEPIWTLNYRRRRPPTRIIRGRLYLACTAQVYPEINSWNSCCNVVQRMTAELAEDTGAHPAPARAPA